MNDMNDTNSMNEILHDRLSGLRHLVGNTPMLAIDFTYHGAPRRLYAKAEHLNMTGSIKDRMALHIVRLGYERGKLAPGTAVVEATSGNTGIAVAGVGRSLGHPVTIFMPDWMSRERVDLIRSLGSEVRLVSAAEGGFLGAIDLAEQYAAQQDAAFLPHQFSNEDNVAAHRAGTGPEIWWQLRYHGLEPDAFVAGVGTGGTVMGVGHYLREQKAGLKIHPLEPSNSPTLSTGHRVGKHRIQGVSDEFIPPIVDLDFLDEVVAVDDGDAILMAQKLGRELGLGVGISSGANFLGALSLMERYGPETVVVTVFPDDNKKYLSTDLLREEPERRGFLSTGVSLNRFATFKRVCRTCCDPTDCVVPTLGHHEAEALPCPWKKGGGTNPQ
jgi:cysteine synthase A